MIRSALRGLRGRLLLSLVSTSAVTLAVAAAITLGPLQSRLRNESRTALVQATEDMRGEFSTVMGKNQVKPSKKLDEEYDAKVTAERVNRAQQRQHAGVRPAQPTPAARACSSPTPTFIDADGRAASFLYDTDAGPDNAARCGSRSSRVINNAAEAQINDDELTYAMPIYERRGHLGRRRRPAQPD